MYVLKSPAQSYVYPVPKGPPSYSLGVGTSFAKPGIINRNRANPENELVSLIFSFLTPPHHWQQAFQRNCPALFYGVYCSFYIYILICRSFCWRHFSFQLAMNCILKYNYIILCHCSLSLGYEKMASCLF